MEENFFRCEVFAAMVNEVRNSNNIKRFSIWSSFLSAAVSEWKEKLRTCYAQYCTPNKNFDIMKCEKFYHIIREEKKFMRSEKRGKRFFIPFLSHFLQSVEWCIISFSFLYNHPSYFFFPCRGGKLRGFNLDLIR
jgi:fatty acid desaturase